MKPKDIAKLEPGIYKVKFVHGTYDVAVVGRDTTYDPPDDSKGAWFMNSEYRRSRHTELIRTDWNVIESVELIETSALARVDKQIQDNLADQLVAARAQLDIARDERDRYWKEKDTLERRLKLALDDVTKWKVAPPALHPIHMRLPCEKCGELHVDEGEFATKPHHTHQCAKCGLVWRPAIECTVGVAFLWEQVK